MMIINSRILSGFWGNGSKGTSTALDASLSCLHLLYIHYLPKFYFTIKKEMEKGQA